MLILLVFSGCSRETVDTSKFNIVTSFYPMYIATANIVFFIKMYIGSYVPDSLIEAARIDGCSEFKIFNKIVLPIITPAVAIM